MDKNQAADKTLKGQIQELRDNGQLNVRKRTPKAHRCAVTDWRGDGIDHINVSTMGATPLGRFLAHESNYKVVNPVLGSFSSVRSMWMWLKTRNRDDRLRTRMGASARTLFESLERREVTNFRAIILDTDWQKFKQYPDAMQALKTCTYAFDTYFYGRGNSLPRRPSTFHWMVEGWEELRRAAREDREPDLTPWLDVEGSGIYDFVFRNDGTASGTITRPSFENKVVRRFDRPEGERRNGDRPARDNNRHRNQRNGNQTIAGVKDSVVELNQQSTVVDATADATLKGLVHVVDVEHDTAVAHEGSTTAILPESSVASALPIVADLNVSSIDLPVTIPSHETTGAVNLQEEINRAAAAASTVDPSEDTAMAAALRSALK